MGLPEIFISFQTAAVSAITRSARGVLAVAVKDATAGGATEAAYKSLAEVPEDKFSPENYRLLKLAFLAAPTKVWVLRVGEDAEKTYQALERLRFDWLAAPGLEDARVMSFIKTLRNGGRGVKAVVANATAPDCEGIVNLCVSGLTLEDGAMEAKDYAVRVAALLAARLESSIGRMKYSQQGILALDKIVRGISNELIAAGGSEIRTNFAKVNTMIAVLSCDDVGKGCGIYGR